MSNEKLLVINAGSSSLKFHLYQIRDYEQATFEDLNLLFAGHLSGIGGAMAHIRILGPQGQPVLDRSAKENELKDLSAAQSFLAHWYSETINTTPLAVGHRIVHGGSKMHQSTIINDEVLAYLDALAPLAPLHQHNNLAPVHVIREHWPDLLQVACFDTAFHRTHCAMLGYYALPKEFYDEGVQRYGFHGLSYQYVAHYLRTHLPELYQQRVIVAHLGSGASACMMSQGKSLDTTMGFTALEGLPMATRPGRLDAGVVLWWMQQKQFTAAEIQHLLYNCSGMKGLSGISSDMRELLASNEESAQLALDYYAHHSAECMAGLGVISKGIDAIVFTAGVGENSPELREMIIDKLSWLGAKIDPERNLQSMQKISTKDSKISVWVIPTNEELVIARDTLLLAQQKTRMFVDRDR